MTLPFKREVVGGKFQRHITFTNLEIGIWLLSLIVSDQKNLSEFLKFMHPYKLLLKSF